MKLYNHPASPNSRKVLMVAHLLNMPLENELVDLFAGSQKSPAYLAVNPNGKVPALADGGLILWESNAIMKYLAVREPERSLWPAGAREQAEIDRWLFWEQAHLAGVALRIARENLFKPMRGGSPDAAAVAEAIDEFRTLAAVLDGHLASRAFIAGGPMSLADIAISCQLMFAGQTGMPVGDYANLTRWHGAVRASGAWQATEFKLEPSKAN
jgi:glutathione S-transferase